MSSGASWSALATTIGVTNTALRSPEALSICRLTAPWGSARSAGRGSMDSPAGTKESRHRAASPLSPRSSGGRSRPPASGPGSVLRPGSRTRWPDPRRRRTRRHLPLPAPRRWPVWSRRSTSRRYRLPRRALERCPPAGEPPPLVSSATAEPNRIESPVTPPVGCCGRASHERAYSILNTGSRQSFMCTIIVISDHPPCRALRGPSLAAPGARYRLRTRWVGVSPHNVDSQRSLHGSGLTTRRGSRGRSGRSARDHRRC